MLPRVTKPRRAGAMSVELFLITPILLVLAVAGIELSILASVGQELAIASAQGARVAAQGGDEKEIEDAVQKALRAGLADVVKTTTNLDHQPQSGDQVEVIVEVRATDAVPDLLGWIGFSLQGEALGSRTALRKE